MPRTAAKFTQADLGRAIREIQRAFGATQVIFDSSGNARVVPLTQPELVKLTSNNDPSPTTNDRDGVDL